jgi:hypothetical protein
LSAVAQRAKAEAIHRAATRKNGLLRRFAPLHKRFAFVAGNDVANSEYDFAISRHDLPGVLQENLAP